MTTAVKIILIEQPAVTFPFFEYSNVPPIRGDDLQCPISNNMEMAAAFWPINRIP